MTAGFAAIWVISQGTEPVLLCEGANVISTALIRSYSAIRRGSSICCSFAQVTLCSGRPE
jgi:hypothetical protein